MGCHAVVRCSDPIPERYAFLAVEETPDTVDEDAAVILSVDVADRKLLGDLTNPMADGLPLQLTTTSHRSFAKDAVCIQKQPLPVKSSMRLQRNCL